MGGFVFNAFMFGLVGALAETWQSVDGRIIINIGIFTKVWAKVREIYKG